MTEGHMHKENCHTPKTDSKHLILIDLRNIWHWKTSATILKSKN